MRVRQRNPAKRSTGRSQGDLPYGTTFSDTSRYLGIKVGADAEITPRTRIATAAYAFRVQTIDEATGGDIYSNITLHSYLSVGDGDEWGRISVFNGIDPSSTVSIQGKDGADNGSIIKLDNSGYDPTIILDADDSQVVDVGGVLRLADGVVDTTVTLDAWDVGGGALMTLGNSEGDATIILDARDAQEPGDVGARVTLLDGTSEAVILNAIDPSTSFGAQLIMRVGNDTTVSVYANGNTGDGGGIIRLYEDDGTKTVHIDAQGEGSTLGGAQLSLSDNDGTTTISMDAQSGSAKGAFLGMYDSSGNKTIHMDAYESGGGAQVFFYEEDGTATIDIDAESGTGGGANIQLKDSAGNTTIRLDADWGGTGEGRVITDVLEIKGGADLSE